MAEDHSRFVAAMADFERRFDGAYNDYQPDDPNDFDSEVGGGDVRFPQDGPSHPDVFASRVLELQEAQENDLALVENVRALVEAEGGGTV